MKKLFSFVISVLIGIYVCGCTTTQTHTATGTVLGGTLGAVVGHQLGGSGARDKGALVGAAAGALLGHQAGVQKETSQKQQAQIDALQQKTSARTVWLQNPNGSKTPVTLRQATGGQWVGPKGEYYQTFPTAEQLKPLYGIK